MGSISYDSNNDVIIVSGYKDTSTNPPTPWNIEDIHNADSSNNWGKTLFDKNPDNGKRCLIVKCHLRIEGGGEYNGSDPTFVMDRTDILWVEKSLIIETDTYVKIGDEADPFGTGEKYGYNGPVISSARWYSVSWGTGPDDWRCIQIRGKARIYGAVIFPQDGRFSVTDDADVEIKDTDIYNANRFASSNLKMIRVKLFSIDQTGFNEFTKTPAQLDDIVIQNTEYLLSFYQASNSSVIIKRPKFVNCKNAWSLPDCANGKFYVIDAVPLPDPRNITWLRGWNMEGAEVYFQFTLKIIAKDSNGNPVSNAIVNVVDSKGNIQSSITDSNGISTITVTSFKARVSTSSSSDADVIKGPYDNNFYWHVWTYTPFIISVWKENYNQFVLKTDIVKPTDITAVLSVSGIKFGELAISNRYEEGEDIVMAIALYTYDGTPVTNGVVKVKIIKPDGTIIQDWTNATHIGDGIYIFTINSLQKGTYIVIYDGEYNGIKTMGADVIKVTKDKYEIIGMIKRHPL